MTEVRTAACPRGCGGTLTIHDRLPEGVGPRSGAVPEADPASGPGGWEIVGVRCSMGCQLRPGEVPRRG